LVKAIAKVKKVTAKLNATTKPNQTKLQAIKAKIATATNPKKIAALKA